MQLTLRALEDGDVPLVARWLQAPHVKPWYGEAADWLAEINARRGEFAFIRHFIAYIGEKPVGFGQYYACRDAREDWYAGLPLDGVYSVDYLIGDAEYLGAGVGKKLVGALARAVFQRADARAIIVQPEPENAPSRRALLACGFVFDAPKGFFILERGALA